jgi:transmembrane sensor
VIERVTKRWWTDAEHDAIHEAAAEWFACLQDPELKLDETASWQEWMTADPRHAEAFRRIEEVWHEAALIRDTERRDRVRYDPDVSVTTWLSGQAMRRRAFVGLAAAAVVSSAVVGGLWLLSSEKNPWLETEVGQNRSVRLADGSRVELGGATALRIDMDDVSRRVTLIRGEAFFKVAKDPARPFRVRVGDTTVTAVGTAFNVRRNAERVVVAVVEGRVTVDNGGHEASVPVAAGESTIATRSSVQRAAPLPSASAVTAWQSGRLSFDHERLRYVLEDVNRYSAKPLVMEDDSIGDLTITGTILSDNVAGWITSIESAFELEAREDGNRIVLRRREPE